MADFLERWDTYFPQLASEKQLSSLSGGLNQLRPFVRNYADLVAPLYRGVNRNTPMDWEKLNQQV